MPKKTELMPEEVMRCFDGNTSIEMLPWRLLICQTMERAHEVTCQASPHG